MPSVREGILEYMTTILNTVPNCVVFRSREAAVNRSEGPAIVLQCQEETREKFSDLNQRCELAVAVILIIRGTVPDSAADPYLVSMQAATMADPTMGGLVGRCILKSTRWEMETADLTALVVESVYHIVYMTPIQSL